MMSKEHKFRVTRIAKYSLILIVAIVLLLGGAVVSVRWDSICDYRATNSLLGSGVINSGSSPVRRSLYGALFDSSETEHESIYLRIDNSKSNVDFQLLSQINGLRKIEIINAELTSEKLSTIGRCDALLDISFENCVFVNCHSLADAGISTPRISIIETPIPIALGVSFVGHKNLESLTLKGSNITDETIMQVGRCESLRSLTLVETSAAGNFLSKLSTHFPSLKELNILDGRPNTHLSLDNIDPSTAIERITLRGPWVNDYNIKPLAYCSKLTNLVLMSSSVSARTKIEFNALLPGCNVQLISPKKQPAP